MNRILPIRSRKLQSPGLALAAALLACGLSGAARAQDIISLKVTSPKNSNQNWMFASDYAGAPGVRTNNWNNLLAAADGSKADIILGDGSIMDSGGNVVSGMAATWHSTQNGSSGFYNRQNGGTNDGKMFGDVDDVWNANSFSSFGYLDLTNVPFTNYAIYCYFRPDNGSGAANTRGGFWLITNTPAGAARLYCKNQSNDVANTQIALPSTSGAGYVQSFTTSIGPGNTAVPFSALDGGNYGVLTGLTNSAVRIWFGGLGNGSGAQDDLGNYVTGGSTAVRFKLCGFQIYQIPSATPTNLYLQNASLTLHAGDPAGTQLTVLANLSDGTLGVSETANCTFSVDNPGVVTVSANGILKAGADGTANVIVTLPSAGLSLTNPVTVLGPTALSLSVAKTNLLLGNGQGDVTSATLYADFSNASHVQVNSFNFVSFNSSPAGVVSTTANGQITATGTGTFSITGVYDGVSVTATNVGTVTAFMAPAGAPAFGVKLTDATHGMTFHDLSGVPGARFAYWNNMALTTGDVTNTLSDPVDNRGNPLTGTAVEVMPGPLDWEGLLTSGTATTNESTLFDTFFDSGMNNGTTVPNTLVISNVPFSSYDVYFYFYNDNTAGGTNRPGEVVIDGVTQYRINNPSAPTQPDNDGNGYVVAGPQPSGVPASVANVPWGNVIKFSGVTDPTLTATWAGVGQDYIGDAAAVTRIRLVGVQIVKSLAGLTATNIYLTPSAVPAQLPGNPAGYSLTVLADFSDGTKGGNITTLAGIGYSSSNTNVFMVDTNGVITAGLTPGTATLTVSYQTQSLNTTVTNLAPTSLAVEALPDTVYLDGYLGAQPARAILVANFPGQPSVNVTGFGGVAFVDQGSAAATLNSDGSITANTYGQANLGASYLGTTYVSTNAFTVASISSAPVLKHQYNFHDAPGSTTVVDSVGGANGTVYPALGNNLPITLDGSHAIFPGDAGYTNEPYIALPPGIISAMGDVTIELWCGQSEMKAWSRFLGFGNTPKGTDPRVFGGTATSGLQFLDDYNGLGVPDFASSGAGDLFGPYGFTNGAEYQVVMVLAPNANVAALYINGVLVTNSTPSAAYLNASVNDTVDWLGVSLSNADPPLAGWINNLAIYEGVMPASQVAADYAAGVNVYLPPSTVSVTPAPITFSVSAGNLNLAWPPDHLGWTLETNAVGLTAPNAWFPYAGSTSVTNVSILMGTSGNVFYRLKY